jgi:hypothetical protein
MIHTDISNLGQKLLRLLGILVDPCLDLREQLSATTLDHIAEQCPGSTAESNQRYLTLELLARQGNGIVYVTELSRNIDVLGKHLAVLSVVGVLERVGEVRALLVNHLDSHTHGLWDDKDVGKDDSGIYQACKTADGLEGDFCCNFGVAAAFEEVSFTLGFMIFGEVAAGCQSKLSILYTVGNVFQFHSHLVASPTWADAQRSGLSRNTACLSITFPMSLTTEARITHPMLCEATDHS